ncbi:MAG: DUF177 domain-containing protein [Chloroflexota bacterium]
MSLLFNVAQFLKSDVGEKRTYDFGSDDDLDLGDVTASDIGGHVKFLLTNYEVVAKGHAHALLHESCARCLEPFARLVEVAFEEEYLPMVDIDTGLPTSGPPNDMAFPISSNHTIDLTEALRQDLLLAVELVPLCNDECKGLCPSCGVNRNRERCACSAEQTYGPFAALGGLLSATQSERQH